MLFQGVQIYAGPLNILVLENVKAFALGNLRKKISSFLYVNHWTIKKEDVDEIFTIMERPTRNDKRQAGKPKISYILPD